jgi:hypothetical protein
MSTINFAVSSPGLGSEATAPETLQFPRGAQRIMSILLFYDEPEYMSREPWPVENNDQPGGEVT